MKVKVKDFNIDMVAKMCDIINKGNEVIVKKERENIIVVEVKRQCVIKNPISEN